MGNKKHGVTFPVVSLLIHSSYPIIYWALTNFYMSPKNNLHSLCGSYFLQFAIILCLFSLIDCPTHYLFCLQSDSLIPIPNSGIKHILWQTLLCFLTFLVYLFSYLHVLEYDFTSLSSPLGCESLYRHDFIQKVSQL